MTIERQVICTQRRNGADTLGRSLAGYFLALLACLGEPDGYGLLTALDPAPFATRSALRSAPLKAMHLTFHVLACAGSVLRFAAFAMEHSYGNDVIRLCNRR
jgi:hypothetical protein